MVELPGNAAKDCSSLSLCRTLAWAGRQWRGWTLRIRAGRSVLAQRILRHSDPRLTANIYSRVDLGDLRDGINKIAIPVHAVAGTRTGSTAGRHPSKS